MAGRKNKHSADYFPHYVRHGNKMNYIENKYGNNGYAVWFKLMERLSETDFHYCDLSDESEMMFMASRCNVDENMLKEIISLLSKFEWLDSFLWTNYKVIYSQEFVNSLVEMYKRRNVDSPTLMSTFIHLGVKYPYINSINVDINDNNSYKIHQSKVKESKVKETTINNSPFKIEKTIHIDQAILIIEKDESLLNAISQMIPLGYVLTQIKKFPGHYIRQRSEIKPLREHEKHFSSWVNMEWKKLSGERKIQLKKKYEIS